MKKVLKKVSWRTTVAALLIALNATLYAQGVYGVEIFGLITSALSALGFVSSKDAPASTKERANSADADAKAVAKMASK